MIAIETRPTPYILSFHCYLPQRGQGSSLRYDVALVKFESDLLMHYQVIMQKYMAVKEI